MKLRNLLLVAATAVLVGCAQNPPVVTYVGGYRDSGAIPVRLHNRTNAEIVVKPSVRERFEGVSLNDTLRMSTVASAGRNDGVPDLELSLFASLPRKLENIGAYSLEIFTPETEVRLGVVDISSGEMNEAKIFGRIAFIFRKKGTSVQIGNKGRFVPWLRPLP